MPLKTTHNFWFVTRDEFLALPEENCPCFQELKRENKLTCMDILLADVITGVLRESVVAVSHRWYTRQHFDPEGKKIRRIKRFLEKNDSVRLVWLDWLCLPQRVRIERDREEEIYFCNTLVVMLPNLFLGVTVVVLWDRQYNSRFWPNVEMWTAMQVPTKEGIAPAGDAEYRVVFDCMSGDGAESETRELMNKLWREKSVEEAIRVLRGEDISVTYRSVKETNLCVLSHIERDLKAFLDDPQDHKIMVMNQTDGSDSVHLQMASNTRKEVFNGTAVTIVLDHGDFVEIETQEAKGMVKKTSLHPLPANEKQRRDDVRKALMSRDANTLWISPDAHRSINLGTASRSGGGIMSQPASTREDSDDIYVKDATSCEAADAVAVDIQVSIRASTSSSSIQQLFPTQPVAPQRPQSGPPRKVRPFRRRTARPHEKNSPRASDDAVNDAENAETCTADSDTCAKSMEQGSSSRIRPPPLDDDVMGKVRPPALPNAHFVSPSLTRCTTEPILSASPSALLPQSAGSSPGFASGRKCPNVQVVKDTSLLRQAIECETLLWENVRVIQIAVCEKLLRDVLTHAQNGTTVVHAPRECMGFLTDECSDGGELESMLRQQNILHVVERANGSDKFPQMLAKSLPIGACWAISGTGKIRAAARKFVVSGTSLLPYQWNDADARNKIGLSLAHGLDQGVVFVSERRTCHVITADSAMAGVVYEVDPRDTFVMHDQSPLNATI